ncbi:hypothetical protein [Lederbergia graminis]|uniref:hypothetical protein n=1 Tax=Lederbergia graminis TaxID=735518 RepID=UPI0036D4182D
MNKMELYIIEESKKWIMYEEELQIMKQQDYLSIYEYISFKDISNTIFGMNAKRYQKSCFRIIDNT